MDLFPATREGETHGRCLPVITEEDICDRSKSDGFTKVFAFIQCAWLVTQCGTRAAVGLPLTELELMTLAFIVAALVMYSFWRYKPFDVQRATILLCPIERAREVRSRLRRKSQPSQDWTVRGERHQRNVTAREERRQRNVTGDGFEGYLWGVVNHLIITDDCRIDMGPEGFKNIMFITIGIVISCLHILAWSWSFPSHTIQILWRVFSVAATCSLPVLLIPTHSLDTGFCGLCGIILAVCIVVYVISRLGLIVLVFYCFSSMPAAVYETVSWNAVFPHFS
jgi:hypothetical protein